MKCQSCSHENLVTVLDLGKQPICNRFLRREEDFNSERFYPLEFTYCPRCTLAQLSFVPPGKETFAENFDYLTNYTSELVRNAEELAQLFIRQLNLGPDDYVIDIGSNDGTFLKPYKDRGIRVLGIEPTKLPYEAAIKAGIDTINRRFEDSLGEILERTGGHIKLITAFNVLAHTDTIHAFLDTVKAIQEQNDAPFISQSHYLPNLIRKCEYDSIYHEHARFYTLGSIKSLFEPHELKVYDAWETTIHGGSLLVCADLGKRQKTSHVNMMLDSEAPFREKSTYESFAKKVGKNRDELRAILKSLKDSDKHIVGIGAPMKSSTLLNYCNIDASVLDYLAEVNPLRIGSFSPGMHIPIVSEARLFEEQPEAALILSWNVAEHIIKNLRKKGYKGVFVIPNPEPKIVE